MPESLSDTGGNPLRNAKFPTPKAAPLIPANFKNCRRVALSCMMSSVKSIGQVWELSKPFASSEHKDLPDRASNDAGVSLVPRGPAGRGAGFRKPNRKTEGRTP